MAVLELPFENQQIVDLELLDDANELSDDVAARHKIPYESLGLSTGANPKFAHSHGGQLGSS